MPVENMIQNPTEFKEHLGISGDSRADPRKYVPPNRRNLMAETANNELPYFLRVSQNPSRKYTNSNQPSSDAPRNRRNFEQFKDSGRRTGYSQRDFASKKVSNEPKVRDWKHRVGVRIPDEEENEVFPSEEKKPTAEINFDAYDEIPVQVTGRDSKSIEPIGFFKEVASAHPSISDNIKRVSFDKPTPVQKHSIPIILAGRDLMACAQTGSGKTAAFMLPIIVRMLNEGPPAPLRDSRQRGRKSYYPVALVLSPTRELALQLYTECRKFSFRTGICAAVLYGGSDVRIQINDLYQKGCDICVATPGRLNDVASRSLVRLQQVRYLVLDEADRMLDMGFFPQIDKIVNEYEMPNTEAGRQTVMFSATFPNEIKKLAATYLFDYIFLTVGRVGSTNDSIKQDLMYVSERAKSKTLLDLLKNEQSHLVLVFVETKRKADSVQEYLSGSKINAVSIHGDKEQRERVAALDLFRRGVVPVLVATDVAARGLDISNIAHVINYDLPSRIEDYVHRIGRTGRAGKVGKATSFLNEQNRPILKDLLGLLQESQQEAPAWIHNLINSCPASYSKYNYFDRSGITRKSDTRKNNNFRGLKGSNTGYNLTIGSRFKDDEEEKGW